MADDAQQPEIQIHVKGPNELKLQISITTDKSVLELKQAIAAKSDVEAARQRLIYSGRVLKDEDQLSVYKIQSGHTIHMVKGVARQNNPSSTSAVPQQLPTMQAGQNIHDPLTQLNSHLGFGIPLNPFADLGVNPNDPNLMQNMFNNPQFVQQMASAMQDPAVIDQIIAMNPQLQAMGPQVRQMFQSEHFRQLMSNPEQLQGVLRMASMLRENGGGGGPFGNPFGAQPNFPVPGVPGQSPSASSPPPNNTTSSNASTSPTSGTSPVFPNMASLFGQSSTGTNSPSPNPFGLLGTPFAPFTPPAAPTDTRPPEERFQVQLQQLQEMGFTNASQNIRALLATGGNVHSAIEYILSGGGV